MVQKIQAVAKPKRQAASVPASDLRGEKRVPEKGSRGVYFPKRRPKTEAAVSQMARMLMERQAMSLRIE